MFPLMTGKTIDENVFARSVQSIGYAVKETASELIDNGRTETFFIRRGMKSRSERMKCQT